MSARVQARRGRVVVVAAVGALAALAAIAASLVAAPDARAQCSANASSCVTCHESAAEHPVLSDGRAWHGDHAFADLCVACHGGDPSAATKDAAHAGLAPPLDDVHRACGGCHGDADARADRYRAAAAGAPTSATKPPPPSPPTPPTAPPQAPPPQGPAARALSFVAAALGFALLALVATDRRRWLARLRDVRWVRARRWSPTSAGAALGVVVAASEVLFGRPLAASGAFDALAAYAGRALFPHATYWRFVVRPAITWHVWVVVGALLGSSLSAALAGVLRRSWLPERGWTRTFGTRRSVRLAVVFGAGVLVQIGAGIAGGCTSGLAISGGALLSPAAFVFMAGMFAGGIPAAWLWSRRRRERAS